MKQKENSALMRNSLLVFLSGAAHSRMKLPGFPGSCNYVVNSLRQLVETLDPSPEYTYRHLFYEVVVIIDFGTWKVYGQSFSKSRYIFVTITDFCMSYILFPYNFNILFQKSQISCFIFVLIHSEFSVPSDMLIQRSLQLLHCLHDRGPRTGEIETLKLRCLRSEHLARVQP